MHVLHIVNNCRRGGVGYVIVPLIEELTNQNIRFTVAYLKKPETLKEEYKKLGTKTLFLGTNPLVIIYKLLRVINNKNNPISLIHTHLVHASLLGRLLGIIFKIPIVTTRHYNERNKKYNLFYFLEDITLKYSNLVIAISEAVKKHLIFSNFVKSEKCQTIYNPINLKLLEYNNSIELRNKKNILCNARLIKVKGVEYLIDAFNIIGEKIPEAKLLLIGRNDNNVNVIKKITNHRFRDRIIIMGFIPREEIIKELSKTRVYVQPSLSEGLGLSAIEAMGMRCPCILSNVGGLIELSNKNVNAILVPAGDSKLLAEEIISLWRNIKKSKRIGSNAKKYVIKNFDSKRIAIQYLNAYKSINKDGE